MCQTSSLFFDSCIQPQQGIGTHFFLPRESFALRLLFSEKSIRASLRRILSYLSGSPIEDCLRSCSSGFRQCDRLALGSLDLARKLEQPVYECISSSVCRGMLSGIQLYGLLVSVFFAFQFSSFSLSSFEGCLPSLTAISQGCLSNTFHRFLESRPRSLPFRVPLSGLLHWRTNTVNRNFDTFKRFR